MISTRKLYQKISIKLLRHIHTNRNIIFYCGGSFHIPHLSQVIAHFSKQSQYRVHVVCPDPFDQSAYPQATCWTSNLDDLPRYIIIDVLVSTEVSSVPYYFCGTSVYFGHGIGPKMNYQLNSNIRSFDYIFSPCTFFYHNFLKILPSNRVRKIGLPILDEVAPRENKDIILYAPSWCTDSRFISDVDEIVSRLANLDRWRIIVSLHPRLLKENHGETATKTRFSFDRFPNIELLHDTEYDSSFEVLDSALMVIGEISSILFEAMAFHIPIVFDGNTKIFEFCNATSILPRLKNAAYDLEDISSNEKVAAILHSDVKRTDRERFSNYYFLNLNRAGDVFIRELEAIV